MNICEKVLLNLKDITQTVLFAGSGLSVKAGMKSWEGTILEVIEECKTINGEPPTIQYLESLNKKHNYPQLMQVVHDELTKVQYLNMLEKIFRKEVNCTDEHKIIAKIPFAGIITTNFDKLLETGYALENGKSLFTQTYEAEDVKRLLGWNKNFLFKFHGDVDKIDKIIIKKNDYEELLKTSDIKDLFRKYLLSHQVLFLGYSMRDPDLINLWEFIDQNVKLKAPGILVVQKDNYGIEEISRLKKLNILVVEPDNRDDTYGFIIELLSCLKKQSTSATLKPLEIIIDERQLLDVSLMLINIFDIEQTNNFNRFLKSTVMTVLIKSHEKHVTFNSLYKTIADLLGVANPTLEQNVKTVIGDLNQKKVISIDESNIAITEKVKLGYGNAIHKFQVEIQAASSSLVERVCLKEGIVQEQGDDVLIKDVLYELIRVHGKRLAENILFYKRFSGEEQEFNSMIDEFLRSKNAIAKNEFVRSVIRELINNATSNEETILFKLLQMYFLTSSFTLSFSSERLLKEYVQGFVAYFDSNIILQAMAPGHLNNEISLRVLEKTKSLGIKLNVLNVILNEIVGHIDLSLKKYQELVQEGIPAIDTIGAYVRLVGARRSNVFLLGYSMSIKQGKEITWEDYMAEYTHKKKGTLMPSVEKIQSYFLNRFNIEKKEVDFLEPEQIEISKLTEEVISLRKLGGRFTNDILCKDEAQQFLWIYKERKINNKLSDKVWFVTNDHFILDLYEKNRERYPIPCSYSPIGWYQYLQLVDYDARATRNFGRLFAFAEIGAMDDELAIETIKRMLNKEADLIKKGAISAHEFADDLVKKHHIKSIIEDYSREKRLGKVSKIEFEGKIQEKINSVFDEYVALKKIDLTKLQDIEGKLTTTEKKLKQEKFKRKQLAVQLRSFQDRSGRKRKHRRK